MAIVERILSVTVVAQNRPPEFSPEFPAAVQGVVGGSFDMSGMVTDPDGDPIVLSVVDPQGLVSLTGNTLNYVKAGTGDVVVRADDGKA